MFLILRVTFTIISALLVAGVFTIGMFFGWGWAGASALLAVAFFMLMLLCKQSQEFAEQKNKAQTGDFIHSQNSDENE